MRMRLITSPRTTSLGQWKQLPNGDWQCGNVQVRCLERYKLPTTGDWEFQTWWVFVFTGTKETKDGWDIVTPDQRPYGYGHAGQAKIGAALMAKYQGAAQ